MDLRNWSLDAIMQLPDHCFGRRWPVSICIDSPTVAFTWEISKFSLPNRFIVWEVGVWNSSGDARTVLTKFLLGNVRPANLVEANQLDGVFGEVWGHDDIQNYFEYNCGGDLFLRRLKLPVHSQGRRLILQVLHTDVASPEITGSLVISSIPNEVPDCLLLANPRSL